MKYLTAFFLLAICVDAFSQQRIEKYYKDYNLEKEVPEKKAKFKKIESKAVDGTLSIKVLDLSNDCLIKEEYYRDSLPTGRWVAYENCTPHETRNFSKLVYSEERADTLFDNNIEDDTSSEYERAQYGNDESAIYQYIFDKIKYPVEARVTGADGVVYMQFIIRSTGEIEMVSIIRGANPYLDYESWELIESMPEWNPATKSGKPIDSYYILPIRFSLK